jgi:hypothetical protein
VLWRARADRGKIDNGKGVGDFVRCGSNDDAWLGGAEIQHFTFNVNETRGTGTIKQDTIFNVTDGVPSGGAIGTCKGSWKRVSTEDPGIGECP